jgi:hypothetical protein
MVSSDGNHSNKIGAIHYPTQVASSEAKNDTAVHHDCVKCQSTRIINYPYIVFIFLIS